jgi:AhpD family alkylhydroperoxidase
MAETETPRIPPGGRRRVGLVNSAILWVVGRATGGRPPNVFTTLARHRRLFRRWLWFAGALMPGGRLPRADTELVILRVAHNTGCSYEWGQHARLARRAGLSAEEVERVRQGPKAPGWSQRQEMLLAAADEMHDDGEISGPLWSRLAAELDDDLMIELCMLVGHYEMLAMTLNSIKVEPEAPAKSLG